MSDERPRADAAERLRVDKEDLRWCCPPEEFDFDSTAEVEPALGVIGQDDAVEALRFGLEVDAPGQNIFVRGLTGTGRSTLVRRLLKEIQPSCPRVEDLLYVHDFSAPDRPRLVRVALGRGAELRDRLDELAEYVGAELAPALSSEPVRERQAAMERDLKQELEDIGAPFEKELEESGLGIVGVQVGGETRPMILPKIDGEPVPLEQLPRLESEGKIAAGAADALARKVEELGARFTQLGHRIQEAQDRHRRAMRQLFESETRRILQFRVREIEEAFPIEAVRSFLAQVIEDVIRNRLRGEEGLGQGSLRRYRANLILGHPADAPCPILIENTPTLSNLLGGIDRKVTPQGAVQSDHMMIRAGSLLRADGGYLILEARDVLSEPGAWKVLVRTLRTGMLEIVPNESLFFGPFAGMKPEPIEVHVKVILLGDPGLYYLLDAHDPDFPNLFKVLADFDVTVPSDKEGYRYYAGVLARVAREEELPHFDRYAVAALAEHGARIAERRDRLTTRFARLTDLAREAAFLARQDGRPLVEARDVAEAVRRTKRRADLPARRFRELLREGTIRVETRGAVVGQVNGLAVTRAGPLTYGFPARITATIGPGSAGAINIEREAQLSGAIHTKGFYILGGLLRFLLPTSHPLAFSASIAFEQSYGGIDGDSASGAEMCCLLSALTDVPLRQDLAMTGAIDQHGRIQAIGATSEKIEGFYDACTDGGLTGTQGVLVPRANLRNLMLRQDVVAACDAGRFHVYAVDTIHEALEIFTGLPAGQRDAVGEYPPGTLLAIAMERAHTYWRYAVGTQAAAAAAATGVLEEAAAAERGARIG